jgi:transposase InsO family protein
VKYAFIERHDREFRIAAMCRALKVSKSGYYDWLQRIVCAKRDGNVGLLAQIRAVHVEHRRAYGALKTWRTLKERGIACGKHRVARLRRDAGIHALRKRAFRPRAGTVRRPLAAPDLVERQFAAARPNLVWVGDMTFIRTLAGWLYLAIVLDLYSRRVVGWAMGNSPNENLAVAAVDMALAQRCPDPGLIVHTDQGTPYTSGKYRSHLEAAGLRPSNGAAGECWDNAVAESFFSSLKNELIHHCRFESPDKARAAVFDYIEVFYNRKRIHQYLDYRCPVSFELDAVSTCP